VASTGSKNRVHICLEFEQGTVEKQQEKVARLVEKRGEGSLVLAVLFGCSVLQFEKLL
jgi:hypothetical protein